MKYLKSLASLLLLSSFRFGIFLGLSLLIVNFIASNPENLKDPLKRNNVQGAFIETAIDESAKNVDQNSESSLPLDDEKIQEVIKMSFDSEELGSAFDKVFDGFYAWLNGDSAQVKFSADMTKSKENLANNLSLYAVQRMSKLDPCVTLPEQTNAFLIECFPAGINLSEVSQNIKQSLLDDDSLLPDGRLDDSILPTNASGQTFAEQYDQLPGYYNWFKVLPYILIGFSVALAGVVIFFAKHRLNALQVFVFNILTTSLILAILPLFYVYVLPKISPNLNFLNNSGSDTAISKAFNGASEDIYKVFIYYALNVVFQVVVACLVVLFIIRYYKKSSVNLQNKGLNSSLVSGEMNDKTIITPPDPGLDIQSSEESRNVKSSVKLKNK